MRYLLFIICFIFMGTSKVQSEPMQSTIGHLYWGLGPNFGLTGNVRLGFGSLEIGLLQNTGIGAVYIHRTSTPVFFQIGMVSTNGGGGIIGGGGMEWNTSSYFRWRTDITVTTDRSYQTDGFVSVGGVLIL